MRSISTCCEPRATASGSFAPLRSVVCLGKLRCPAHTEEKAVAELESQVITVSRCSEAHTMKTPASFPTIVVLPSFVLANGALAGLFKDADAAGFSTEVTRLGPPWKAAW
jgi:hypothetical protein